MLSLSGRQTPALDQVLQLWIQEFDPMLGLASKTPNFCRFSPHLEFWAFHNGKTLRELYDSLQRSSDWEEAAQVARFPGDVQLVYSLCLVTSRRQWLLTCFRTFDVKLNLPALRADNTTCCESMSLGGGTLM